MTETVAALDVIDKALTAIDPHLGPDDRAKLAEAIVVIRDALQPDQPLVQRAIERWHADMPKRVAFARALFGEPPEDADARQVRTVHAYVLAQPGLAHCTVLDDRALLTELVRTSGFGRVKAPRWSHVGACLGHGSGVSAAICEALGLDPNEQVGDDDEPAEDT